MIYNKYLRMLSFFIFPAIVFFFIFFVEKFFDLSYFFPWADIPMHFIGGISIGWMFVLFLRFWKHENLLKINSKLIAVLFVVGVVCFIAVLWEFWEFYFSWTIGWAYKYSLEDTLSDLCMGVLGGLSVGIFSKI